MSLDKKLQSLLAEQARLEEMKSAVRKDAIRDVNNLIATFGLKPDDLKFGAKAVPVVMSEPKVRKAPKAKRAVAPKYRLPTGETWTGRGKQPRWLAEQVSKGKKVEDFLIAAPAKSAAPAKKTAKKATKKVAKVPRKAGKSAAPKN
jgi:DNA-binding protein H-NS